MIDLHSHVLPGLDDGPPDMSSSVAMARVAADSGTRRLVATPHLREDFPRVHIAELADRVTQLNAAIQRHGIDLEVVRGAEVDLATALDASDEELRQVTLAANGSDLLIETPYRPVPSILESLLDVLRHRGFRVTLAHPELNASFHRDPERLGRLADAGVHLQLTARSLRLQRGSRARDLALTAIKRGWAHVLASDGHSSQWRAPCLGSELKDAQRRHPELALRLAWMVGDAPAAILNATALPPIPAVDPHLRSRRLLGRH